MRGFRVRAPVAAAWAWIDTHLAPRPAEELDLERAPGAAAGRVLAAALAAPRDLPDTDRAAANGFALRADETVGAGAYAPLLFPLAGAAAGLEPGAAARVASGDPLPAGADAVVPVEQATALAGVVEVTAAVAPGNLVERRAEALAAGTPVLAAGRRLRPQDLALLALLGVTRVRVVGQPRVRLVLAGRRPPGVPDALGPLLAALVARDGGRIADLRTAHGIEALSQALTAGDVDLVLVAGACGAGPEDDAPAALATVGTLDLHGLALRPGGAAGLGRAGIVPVVLVPGRPADALAAYELVAGRAVRRLAGRPDDLPHARRTCTLARKLVSAPGFLDLSPVRREGAQAVPLAAEGSLGLWSAVRGDGFVLVPAGREGFASGAEVTVYLYNEHEIPD